MGYLQSSPHLIDASLQKIGTSWQLMYLFPYSSFAKINTTCLMLSIKLLHLSVVKVHRVFTLGRTLLSSVVEIGPEMIALLAI
jgi:hypothetical protein